jgi:hypothetical protein
MMKVHVRGVVVVWNLTVIPICGFVPSAGELISRDLGVGKNENNRRFKKIGRIESLQKLFQEIYDVD